MTLRVQKSPFLMFGDVLTYRKGKKKKKTNRVC